MKTFHHLGIDPAVPGGGLTFVTNVSMRAGRVVRVTTAPLPPVGARLAGKNAEATSPAPQKGVGGSFLP